MPDRLTNPDACATRGRTCYGRVRPTYGDSEAATPRRDATTFRGPAKNVREAFGSDRPYAVQPRGSLAGYAPPDVARAWQRQHPPATRVQKTHPHYSLTCKCSPTRRHALLDFDIEALLRRKLEADRRPPDGKLHASGDLIGSLRHSQLKIAGAPTVQSDIVGDVRLRTGTLIHTDFERIFRGKPVMLEVKLDDYLPEGWSGTSDYVIWNFERRAFVLGDLKTVKAEALPWILKEGVKDSHQHQLTAYYRALRKMGIPLLEGYGVLYLPITQDVREPVQPTWQEATPLPDDYMDELMSSRWAAAQAYLSSIGGGKSNKRFLTDELAPVQERVWKTYWNKSASKAKGVDTPGVEAKLVPDWSTTYCEFPSDLCNCRSQRPEKAGTWFAGPEGVTFTPSRGKEGMVVDSDPRIRPSDKQIADLKAAYAAAS
jgi:hypothetical protein